jgi:hypothetical protein
MNTKRSRVRRGLLVLSAGLLVLIVFGLLVATHNWTPRGQDQLSEDLHRNASRVFGAENVVDLENRLREFGSLRSLRRLAVDPPLVVAVGDSETYYVTTAKDLPMLGVAACSAAPDAFNAGDLYEWIVINTSGARVLYRSQLPPVPGCVAPPWYVAYKEKAAQECFARVYPDLMSRLKDSGYQVAMFPSRHQALRH